MPRRLALALLAVLALLAACGTTAAPPAAPRLAQLVDGITIGLDATESPKLNASEELIVTLLDAQGKPIDGADVYVNMVMTAMPMGTNRPIAEPQGQGRYKASTAFTMDGKWDVTVVATVAGKEYKATFNITAVK